MKFLWLVACGVTVVLMSGCTSGAPPEAPASLRTASDAIGYSVPLLPGEQVIALTNPAGDAVVHWGGTEDSVRWTLYRQGAGKSIEDATALLNLLGLGWLRGDTIKFVPRTPASIEGYSFSATVVLGVPFKRSPIVVDGVLGKTTVTDVDTTIVVRNAHRVSVLRVRASCDIMSLDGGVECEVAVPPSGSCTIRAVKGDIILRIPTNTSATITAQTSNGTITRAYLAFTQVTEQPGQFSGQLGTGSGQILLQTGEGNIIVQGVVP